jgi:hypothetical protein
MTQPDQGAQVIYPTVVVKKIITQIVATPTVTPEPPPEQKEYVAVSASTDNWDPFSAPIYYPIQGCAASRLHEGDVAFVANGGGTIGVHYSKDVGYAPIWRTLAAGELIDILKGPWCAEGNLVWKVATADSYVGFVAEGNGTTYWLLPMPPDTTRVLSKEMLRVRELVAPGETLSLNRNNACR